VRALDLHLRDRDAWFLARRRLGFSVLIGLLAGAVLSAFAAWQVSVLGAWCVMSGLFIVLTWATMLRSDSDRTRALATREDESRATADLILVVACIASLVGARCLAREYHERAAPQGRSFRRRGLVAIG